jgi:hypothetical protein
MRPIADPQQVRTPTVIHPIQILKAVIISLVIDLKQSLNRGWETPLTEAPKGA